MARNTATLRQWGGLAFLNFILQALPLVLGLSEARRAKKAEQAKRAEIDQQQETDARTYRDNLRRPGGRAPGSVENSDGAFTTALKTLTGA